MMVVASLRHLKTNIGRSSVGNEIEINYLFRIVINIKIEFLKFT